MFAALYTKNWLSWLSISAGPIEKSDCGILSKVAMVLHKHMCKQYNPAFQWVVVENHFFSSFFLCFWRKHILRRGNDAGSATASDWSRAGSIIFSSIYHKERLTEDHAHQGGVGVWRGSSLLWPLIKQEPKARSLYFGFRQLMSAELLNSSHHDDQNRNRKARPDLLEI